MPDALTTNTPTIGEVLLLRLPVYTPPGREQQGLRPALVIAEPRRGGKTRFEIVFSAPLTSQHEAWTKVDPNLYPLLKKGVGGLVHDSAVLLEHARGVDAARVVRRLGKLTPDEYAPVRRLLGQMFDFEATSV